MASLGRLDGIGSRRQKEDADRMSGRVEMTAGAVAAPGVDGRIGTRASSPALVGRVQELAVLDAIYGRVAGGRSATVVVGGDAGIGKTRLVQELCGRATRAGALVATGGCSPVHGGGLAYGPVIGMLRDVARVTGRDEAPAILSTLTGGSAARPTPASEPGPPALGRSLNDELARTRLFDAILRWVSGLCHHSPVVLVFEDVHWADSATAQLLGFLSRNLATERVLLVATYRTEEIGRDHQLRPWLSELTRLGHVTHLRLDGLERLELAALIAGIVGTEPGWALVDAIYTRSEGNPFFAEELIAARDDPTLSPEFRDVVLARVERLSSLAQRVLRLAAAAGAVVDHDLLAAAHDLDDDAFERALAEAVDQNVLVVEHDRAAYRFRHVLVHEAVVGALLPGERHRLHRRLAEAMTADPSLLQREPGRRVGELAAHHWLAGDWEAALACSVDAADAASAVWAFPEALLHLERAIACRERIAPDQGSDRGPVGGSLPSGAALLERAARAAANGMDHVRAVDLARRAIASVDADDDPFLLANCYTQLGASLWETGQAEPAFEAYERAAAVVPTDPPTPSLVRILACRAALLMVTFHYVEAERRARDALELARDVGARAMEGHLLNTLGVSRGGQGHWDEAIRLVRQSLAIAEEVDDPNDLNRAYANLSHLLLESGRLDEAADMLPSGSREASDRWGIMLSGATANSADALVRLGRYDEAARVLAEVGEQGLGACRPTPPTRRAQIALRRGRLEEAARELKDVDVLTSTVGDVQFRGLYHVLCAELSLLLGRPSTAFAHIEEALGLAAGTDDVMLRPEMITVGVQALADEVAQAKAHNRHLDTDKIARRAAELTDEIAALAARLVAGGGRCPPRVTALVATARAECSRLDGDGLDHWHEAAHRWEEAQEPYHVAYCRWREAEDLLDARAQRARGTSSLQQAWRTATSIGAGALCDRIEQLALRARVPLGRADDGDGDARADAADAAVRKLGLTPREVEVLAHLGAGLTDREIADSLVISKKTASVHVSNLLRKLGVANRVEAGKVAQAHSLEL